MIGNVHKTKKFYSSMDIAKFVACICVVAIHTGPFANVDETLRWGLYASLIELAVPFFFVSSGFFLGKKVLKGVKPVKEIIKDYILRLLKPYIFFSIINILENIVLMLHSGENIKIILLDVLQSVIFYPYGALWFVWACIVGALMLYPFMKYKKCNTAIAIGVLLYMFAMLCSSYSFAVEGTIVQKLTEGYLNIFQTYMNGVLVGFVFLGLGIKCAEIEESPFNVRSAIILMFIVAYALNIVEKMCLRSVSVESSYVFSYLLLCPLLVLVLIHTKIIISPKASVLLRNLSTGIYFMHRPVLFFVEIAFLNPLVRFVIVTVSCIAICVVVYKIKPKYLYELLK